MKILLKNNIDMNLIGMLHTLRINRTRSLCIKSRYVCINKLKHTDFAMVQMCAFKDKIHFFNLNKTILHLQH